MFSSDTTEMSCDREDNVAADGDLLPCDGEDPVAPLQAHVHAIEPSGTVLTRNPAGAGTFKTVASRPVRRTPCRSPQNTFRGTKSFWALLVVTMNPRPSLAAGLRNVLANDADNLARHIEHWASGVPGVDCGRGLKGLR